MGHAWHTDVKAKSVLPFSTLSLGGDATMHIRLQMSYYHNQIDVMNKDSITGCFRLEQSDKSQAALGGKRNH